MGGDTRFWQFFGGIWLVVGLGFLAASLGANLFADPATQNQDVPRWVFALAGLVLSGAGGFIIWRALSLAARDQRLMQTGIEVPATVTDLRRSKIDINRQARWHVCYRYQYNGRSLQGESRALTGDRVMDFKPGDAVQIKIDPLKPEESLFLGPA
jgi:hypothetical protein